MKFKVAVTHYVDVEIDESKYEEWIEDFDNVIGYIGDIEDHAKNLARLQVENEFWPDAFVEGYGKLNEAGIKLNLSFETEEEII